MIYEPDPTPFHPWVRRLGRFVSWKWFRARHGCPSFGEQLDAFGYRNLEAAIAVGTPREEILAWFDELSGLVKPNGLFMATVVERSRRSPEPPHLPIVLITIYCGEATEWIPTGRVKLSSALPDVLEDGEWFAKLMYETPDDDDQGKLIASQLSSFDTSPALRLSAS
jgi:hypothetical protein